MRVIEPEPTQLLASQVKPRTRLQSGRAKLDYLDSAAQGWHIALECSDPASHKRLRKQLELWFLAITKDHEAFFRTSTKTPETRTSHTHT